MDRCSAFVPATGVPLTASPAAAALCPARPAPFFSTMAFGAPLPATIAPPPRTASTRMEVTVVVGDSEPIEGALRRFKKEVSKSGHLFELRRRRYFETNTEKRIRKAAAAKRKARMTRNSARHNQRMPS